MSSQPFLVSDKSFVKPAVNTDVDETDIRSSVLKVISWLRYIASKWQILILALIIGAAIGFLYAHFKKIVFVANCSFVLEEDNSNSFGQFGGLASVIGMDAGGGLFKGENIVELYKSRSMIVKALLSKANHGKNELLIDRYIDINKLREKWKGQAQKNIKFNPNAKTPLTRLQDSVLQTVVNGVSANYLNVDKPDKKLSIIQVSVKSPDEVFSMDFNNEIVKKVNEFYIQTKTKKASQDLALLQKQVDSVQAGLNRSIYSSVIINDVTPNLNPTKQILRLPAQKSQLNAEINKTVLAELLKNLEVAKISLRKETPLIQVIDAPIFPLIKQKPSRSTSMIFGGSLSIFVTILMLTVKMMYRKVMFA